jgi:inorganic pyrophosphatase/exopolyphosphatase
MSHYHVAAKLMRCLFRIRERHGSISEKKATLLEEIETVGEAVLRSRLVENYNKRMAKLAENDNEKTEDELLGIKKKIWRVGNSTIDIPAITTTSQSKKSNATADDLVSDIADIASHFVTHVHILAL